MRCSKCDKKINGDHGNHFKNQICLLCVARMEMEASNPNNFSTKCLKCNKSTDKTDRVVVVDFRGVFCKTCYKNGDHTGLHAGVVPCPDGAACISDGRKKL